MFSPPSRLPFIDIKALWKGGYLPALLSAIFFSIKAIFVKLAYQADSVDAVTLLTLRMGLSLPFFFVLFFQGGGAKLDRSTQGHITLLGFFGFYLSSWFDFIGLEWIGVSLERVILFTYPVWVLVAEMIFWNKRATHQRWIGMALCYMGLVVTFIHDLLWLPLPVHVIQGSFWVFLSCLTYAAYYLGLGHLTPRASPACLAGGAGLASSVMVLTHFSFTHKWGEIFMLSSSTWVYGALMALLSTVLPIWLAAQAVAHLGASTAAALGSVGPISTLILGWILLSEPLSALQIFGLVLVLVGVWRLKVSS